jgi:hypothetical protein
MLELIEQGAILHSIDAVTRLVQGRGWISLHVLMNTVIVVAVEVGRGETGKRERGAEEGQQDSRQGERTPLQ